MKITILVDNHGDEGLAVEHGFSLWIEAGGQRILFDTGQGGCLAGNAARLGVDLQGADWIVLSHGHYDHSGALDHVLSRAVRAVLCCHPAAVLPRFARRGPQAASIGMPPASKRALDALPLDRIKWTFEPVWLADGIGLSGYIPRRTDFEDTGGPFFLNPEGTHLDTIEDDQALWLETAEGLVVCVGCCHSGLINTLTRIRQLTGRRQVKTVIGGFHLLGAGQRRLERTIAALADLGVPKLIPCHCTGSLAIEALAKAFPKAVQPGRAGLTLNL